jgi:3-methylcrotonyl-CoA carboxylase alpha subunit
MIRRLLIANRGEIACRIIRSAKQLGIDCAVVHSDVDRNSLAVGMADAAFALHGNSSADTYLNQEKLLQIARDWQADAVHPGYGFLAENAAFARAVDEAGLLFIGPGAEAIAAMGSKSQAKALMQQAGVPVLPGYHGDDQGVDTLQREADAMGYPLLIKAVAGGGGRGLRVVTAAKEFAAALQAVQREAQAAFGDEAVLLEKYLPQARHVEAQVFADTHGNCLHLFDRDCSVQRRHQKLIEEAPAPGIDPQIREQMSAAAVCAAQAIQYTGAGTVEFLYQDGAFYFLEMNTRLQVEHPVTEMVTGIDLVEWQLRVAAGEKLPLLQQDIHCNGVAIEARINAESPAQDFMPASGLIETLQWPQGESVRTDSGFRSGDRVSIFYDSLLGKIIAWGAERAIALARLEQALAGLHICGIESNRDFLRAILRTDSFRGARLGTDFLDSNRQQIMAHLADITAQQSRELNQKYWGELGAWRSLAHNPWSRRFHLLGEDTPGHDGSATEQQLRQTFLKAPLPGRILGIAVKRGDTVCKGQPLLVMEAMKMEHTITARFDCEIEQVHCVENEIVQPDQLLMEFAAAVDEP